MWAGLCVLCKLELSTFGTANSFVKVVFIICKLSKNQFVFTLMQYLLKLALYIAYFMLSFYKCNMVAKSQPTVYECTVVMYVVHCEIESWMVVHFLNN